MTGRALVPAQTASLILVAGLAASCAGHPTVWVRELSAPARALLADAPPFYAPEGPGAPPTAEAAALGAIFEGALHSEVRSAMRHDPALDRAAQVIAENYSESGESMAMALTQWVTYRTGSVGYAPIHNVGFSYRGRSRPLDGFATEFAGKLKASRFPRAYGVARFTEGKVVSQAIVLATEALEVKSFQKSYAPGAPLSLEIRPRDASTDFTFFADADGGAVVEERMQPRPDGTFFVSYPVPTQPGQYFIEVRATEPRALAPDPEHPSTGTLLLLPIYVGVPEPTEPEAFRKGPGAIPVDSSAWSAWIVAMYDAQRARLGKPPLLADARLTAFAQARAEEVARLPFDAPPEPDLPARLGAAGLPVAKRPSWSAGRFDSLSDFLWLRLLSPARRKQMVLSDQVMLGIGIAARPPNDHGLVQFDEAEYILHP
jgi:hypothetical protein